MSHPLSPPIFRGKIPTTSGRLLLAAAVMFALDLPLLAVFVIGLFPFHLTQVAVMVGVLLLSSRRWIAAVLLVVLSVAYVVWRGVPDGWVEWLSAGFSLVPLWVGTFVAYPSPRKRWVYVEEEKGADAAKGEGADTPSH